MRGARTWWALGGALVLLVALAFGLVAWRAHRSLSDRPDEVLAALSEAIGLPVEADGVRVTWWPPGLVVHGIRVPDESPLGPGSLVHADEARLVVRAWPLLYGTVVVKRVEVASPVVRLVRGVDGTWNFAGRPAAALDAGADEPVFENAPGATAQLRVVLPLEHARFDHADLVITHGRLSVRDRAMPGVPEFEISSMDARLRRTAETSTLEFEGGALGGPTGNLRGTLEFPRGGRDVAFELTAADVPASRLPEVMQLARGGIPFGAVLEGVVSAEVSCQFPQQWPPGHAAIRVLVDARDASASMAGGYVTKSAGTPLAMALDLRAEPDLLRVRRAMFESGDARVEVSAAPVDELEPGQQPALRVASENLTGALLADWIPLLGAIAPAGELSLQGTVVPGDSETMAHVQLSGTDLGIRIGREPAELGGAALEFDMGPEGRFTAGVSVQDLRSEDLFAHRLTAALEGGGDEPISVRIDGARGGRAGAELEQLTVECEITDERAEVRRLQVAGLGGTLHARGEIARDEGDVLTMRFDPQWDGVDFAGLLRLFGVEVDIHGLFTGKAALAARRGAEESILETLTGVFDARLDDGSVPDLNLARATVNNLGAIPGLRQAIEDRAEEKVPGLLARTSRIDSLAINGTFADGVVSVSNVELAAPDYSIDAQGQVAFDGAVDLDGDLVLGAEATDALVSVSGILSVLSPDGEPIRIPVSIEGTYPDLVSAPSPAFVTKSVENEATGGAAGFLRRLLGGGWKDEAAAEK
ncbi:MAG: AsmA-like C-terminal region-containing protein [Candidatus Binatia bacterium]|nr:AsmA-like C-terminal region-containing protein [Candidatus Binatia bacterium]